MRLKSCKQLLEMKQLATSIRNEVSVRHAKALHAQGSMTEAVDLLLSVTKSIELSDPWRPAAMILLAETSYLDERFDVRKMHIRRSSTQTYPSQPNFDFSQRCV